MGLDLKGSPFRDEYKYRHKQYRYYENPDLRNRCLGFDLDFVEVRDREIVAFTDVKQLGEELTWLEKNIYPKLDNLKPLLIIEITPDFKKFKVRRITATRTLHFNENTYWNKFLPNIERYIKKLSEKEPKKRRVGL